MIEIHKSWRETHPGAALGILAFQNVIPTKETDQLESKKAELENQLRERFQGQDRASIRSTPVMDAYTGYYRRFKKTYHLLLQLESITKKGKSIPRGPALVQAMFMAELATFLLTAGHDLGMIQNPIKMAASNGDEVYTLMRGDSATCKLGDMIMSDEKGVFCSVIYGQDQRTRITNATQDVVYVTYVPPGIAEPVVNRHLDELEQNIFLISPSAKSTQREIFIA
jgi:DNA/RNA-binding domain of Phe-tRNA-synthetase-like protein